MRAPGGCFLPACGASRIGRSLAADHSSLGPAAGARYPPAVGAGGVGVGTRHLLHSARSCQLALRAVGAARGSPGGGASCLAVGRLSLGTLPCPTAHRSGVRPRPATHWLWMRGWRVWGPVTYPTARAPVGWLCTRWGRHEVTRGRRLLPGCGASGAGRSRTPDHASLGRAAGACYPLAVDAGDVGVPARHLPHSARSCELALRAVEAA